MKTLVVADRAQTKGLVSAAIDLNGGKVLDFEPDLRRAKKRLAHNGIRYNRTVVDVAAVRSGSLAEGPSFLEPLPDIPTIVLLPEDASRNFARRMHVIGAAATCHQSITPEALAHVLALVDMGIEVFARPDGDFNVPRHLPERLSERELQVLSGICEGLQNKEIAHGFKIKEVTVKMHVRSIIKKLDARNRTHAAMIALDLGLVN